MKNSFYYIPGTKSVPSNARSSDAKSFVSTLLSEYDSSDVESNNSIEESNTKSGASYKLFSYDEIMEHFSSVKKITKSNHSVQDPEYHIPDDESNNSYDRKSEASYKDDVNIKEVAENAIKEGKKLAENKNPIQRKSEFTKMLSCLPLLFIAVPANTYKTLMSLSFFLFGLIVCAAVEDRDLRAELLQWTKQQMDAPPLVSEVASTLCMLVDLVTQGMFKNEINDLYYAAENNKERSFNYFSEEFKTVVNNLKETGYWFGLHSTGNDGKRTPNSYPNNTLTPKSYTRVHDNKRVINDQSYDDTAQDLENKYNSLHDINACNR